MFAGHFGLAAMVKNKTPDVPIWALMLSTQLLDIIFVPLLLSGIETMDTVKKGYGGSVIHADYSHSLVGAFIIAVIAGLLSIRFWGKKGGYIIGAMVMSHWFLDLLVHRADLPILPGNLGHLPRLGFGLWKYPAASITLESILIILGIVFYYKSYKIPKSSGKKSYAITATFVLGILLISSLMSDILGIG